METVMLVVVAVAAVLVAVAALLALVRIERGPSMLDRALGLDLLAAALVGVIAIEAAWLRRTETIPILVALSLVGFVGSVAISRFAAREPAAPDARDDADVGDGEERLVAVLRVEDAGEDDGTEESPETPEERP